MKNQTTYRVDLGDLTVLATYPSGETYDLNADGEPCTSTDDLRALITELQHVGYYSAAEARRLAETV